MNFYHSFVWPSYLDALRNAKNQGLSSPPHPLTNIELLQNLMNVLLTTCKSDLTLPSSQLQPRTAGYILQSHQFMKAVARFNSQDKSVFEFMTTCGRSVSEVSSIGLLSKDPSPREIAHFLRSSSLLDKKEIGEYLGKNKDLNKAVLVEYVNSFNFHNIGVLPALRMFLESFRLPGESQQIDRVIEVSQRRMHDE